MPLDEVGRGDRSAAQLRLSVRRQPSWRRPSRRIGCRPSPSNPCWSRRFEHRAGAGVSARAAPSGLEPRPRPIPEPDRALTREAAVPVLNQPHRSRTGLVCRAKARVWLISASWTGRAMLALDELDRTSTTCQVTLPRKIPPVAWLGPLSGSTALPGSGRAVRRGHAGGQRTGRERSPARRHRDPPHPLRGPTVGLRVEVADGSTRLL
jgi:hypothetical protein